MTTHFTQRQCMLIIAMIAIGCIFQLLPENLQFYLRYDQMAIEHGQVWRLITGHLLHLGWFHLISNIGAFILVCLLLSRQLSTIWFLTAVTGIALLCSAGLFVFSTHVKWYVGLSGVIHGIIILGCALALRDKERWAIFLAIGVVIKLGLEQAGISVGTSAAKLGGDIIVDAHLWGAVAGISIALPMLTLPAFTPAVKN